jgi:hypothetical protein
LRGAIIKFTVKVLPPFTPPSHYLFPLKGERAGVRGQESGKAGVWGSEPTKGFMV